MQTDHNTIAIYSRKSKFTGKGESIGNQIELCRAYIQDHYGDAAKQQAAVYEDEGFSGGNLNRPAFRLMMEAVRKGAHRCIIVYRLDRISRSIGDFAGLIQELSQLGVAFISIKEQFDTETPMGRAMMYIASVFSQLERETIAERIRDNMQELAKTGRWLGGVTPTGYQSEAVQYITVDGKTKKSCQLRLVSGEAETIGLLFYLYLENHSLTLTEAELLKRNVRTRSGKYFTRFSIRAILQNPVYMIADREAYEYFQKVQAALFAGREEFDGSCGVMAYNRTQQEKGKSTRFLPPQEWIVAVGKHPGIIPGRQWQQVQEMLEQNKSQTYYRPRSNEALLTGLLFCSCGSRMYPKLGRQRADGSRPYSYVCRMKERSRGNLCRRKNLCGQSLDEAILAQIRLLREDRRAFVRKLKEWTPLKCGRLTYEENLKTLYQERQELTEKMERLVDVLPQFTDETTKGQLQRRICQLQLASEQMEERIEKAKQLVGQQVLEQQALVQTCRTLGSFSESVTKMSVAQKRETLGKLLDRAEWDGTQIRVIFAGGTAAPGGEDSK